MQKEEEIERVPSSLAFPSRENLNDAKMKEEERLRVPISLVCLPHKVFSLL